jgi:hypothetical protein
MWHRLGALAQRAGAALRRFNWTAVAAVLSGMGVVAAVWLGLSASNQAEEANRLARQSVDASVRPLLLPVYALSSATIVEGAPHALSAACPRSRWLVCFLNPSFDPRISVPVQNAGAGTAVVRKARLVLRLRSRERPVHCPREHPAGTFAIASRDYARIEFVGPSAPPREMFDGSATVHLEYTDTAGRQVQGTSFRFRLAPPRYSDVRLSVRN